MQALQCVALFLWYVWTKHTNLLSLTMYIWAFTFFLTWLLYCITRFWTYLLGKGALQIFYYYLLLLSLIIIIIIIIITRKRSRQSTTVIDIRGIISSSTAGQLSRLTKHNCQTRGVFLRIFCYQGGRRRFFRENASAWKRLHLIRLRMEAKSF